MEAKTQEPPMARVVRHGRLEQSVATAMFDARANVFAAIEAAGRQAHEEHRRRVIFARRSLGQRIRWAG